MKNRNNKLTAVVFALCAVLAAGAVFAGVTHYRAKAAPAAGSAVSGGSVLKSSGKGGSVKSSSAAAPVKRTNRVVVLMYHSINHEKKPNCLRVPSQKFAAEMKWLFDNGYHTLSLGELFDAATGSKTVPEKSVVLTFDDGYRDNYQSALPVLRQYHFKATVFMITAKINDTKNGYLTADELKEMDKSGFAVECHTVSHPDLSELSYKQQYRQLFDSRETLQKLLGHPVDFLAYPSGEYNSNTIAAAKKIGYRLCFKEKGGMARLTDNLYAFPRAFVGEDLKDFIKRVKGTAKYSM